ncbi:ABC transporter ATP-binding protein [Rhodospirillum rubrum]|uniref:ABC transporter component n=1 Tax=Rhodospirillum rubrum (strain ATCC 11170 / ATH 1.1.1 / DSM 467 / LMG 4362 / NCIMB 8255 / S1) TaxID=269796 RepID=Q2RQJ4_RHORT|nr:ABC transporter ATP-binding protein [Rhodospirillum rubrum]ABC23601.1 ABC transporter component [Rhodospirillum rubrum ATCC 11170]AEO49339.1 ABC transporter protein [Rhodospirillum rubrum F11]MBK5955276.1 ABC transporter ATP-binding protein [Rhodospirillum rubrum]QXG79563.1 ABC transporter ATP-binding protein [Rhodospirillum rubrum]HAQ01344.1 ABC transporter ATP-binding protein [Rhodospirillum rubrum]
MTTMPPRPDGVVSTAQSPASADPRPNGAPEVIRIRHLAKRFGAVSALDGVDMGVEAGEFVSIMGPSGSGKTTLLNILSLLDQPTEGDYLLDGINTSVVSERERAVIRRERIGLVFQQFHLIPYLSAVENVMLAQHYHSVADRGEALTALGRVGLDHRASHLPSQLSGGEQQRVCIARALINGPSLILADEPTGNLDAANETLVMDLFRALHGEGRTIVLVTHNPDLGRLTDRTIRLQHGRCVD